MEMKRIDEAITVSPQFYASDVAKVAEAGYRSIICNRPDGEASDQPTYAEIEAEAKKHGLEFRYQPVASGKVLDSDSEDFAKANQELPGPVFAYCRTGTRCTVLWSLSQAKSRDLPEIISMTKDAGYDMSGVARRILNGGKTPTDTGDAHYPVVIVGGGAGGIAVASSLKARRPDLEIALIEPTRLDHGWWRHL